MEESFELLSSMSPKVNKNKRCMKKRGTTVLALKKHFRRSSIYDHAKPTKNNESLILIEESSVDSDSPLRSPSPSNANKSHSSDCSGPFFEKYNESPVVISDTDLEEQQEGGVSSDESIHSDEGPKKHGNIVKESDVFKDSGDIQAKFLSETKKNEIESWLLKINNGSTNNSDPSKFSDLSNVQDDRYKKTTSSDSATNSPFVDTASRLFDELFKHNNVINDSPKQNGLYQKYVSDTSLEDSSFLNESKNVIERSLNIRRIEGNISLKESDDLIIINSTMNSLCIEDSFGFTPENVSEDLEKGKLLKGHNKISMWGQEEKVDSTEASCQENNMSPQADVKVTPEIASEIELNGDPLPVDNQENLCEDDKDIVHSENEVCSILDELYGDIWRKNQQSIMTLSERKPKQALKEGNWKSRPHTERKPKASLLYKNPYTPDEISKSNNLLQTLQRSRMKAASESPWVSKLKDLCDPESSPDLPITNLHPTKLDFGSEDQANKERGGCHTPRTTSKYFASGKPDHRYENENSDKENFSDMSGLGESLEERVRKKINNFKDPKKITVNKPVRKRVTKNDENEARKNQLNKVRSTGNDQNDPKKNQNDVKNSPKSVRKTRKKQLKFVTSESSDDSDWSSLEDEGKNGYRNGKHSDGSYSFLASLSASVPITKCDMSARIFRNNFKHYRDQLAKKLFNLYNEKIFDNALPGDMEILWNDRLRGTAGRCECKKITRRTGAVERSAKIILSTKVLDSADRLRDTLLHEMCHAITWIVNQVSDGHGAFWKSWANKAMRTFPELPPIKRCHEYVINTKYTYRCTQCGYSFGRHSKSLDIERKRCGYCLGKFEVFVNKKSKEGGVKSVPSSTKKQATGFALFVKENYATHKTHQLNHAEVMRLLGQKFAEMKTSN